MCNSVIISKCVTMNDRLENRTLIVGEELYKETMPLQMGSRLYQLQGLKPYFWYEVKISYPASIPATFSLQLRKGGSDLRTNHNRRLLNTEKLIFQTESLNPISDQGGTYVLVSVEAEGIVAIPGVQERETVLFNIVCDELLLGLPHKAWPVVILAVLCLALGFILPLFFRLPFLVKGESQQRHELKHR
ncbi:hypothetical protein V2J09_023440 [Rumex salicifolius]